MEEMGQLSHLEGYICQDAFPSIAKIQEKKNVPNIPAAACVINVNQTTKDPNMIQNVAFFFFC